MENFSTRCTIRLITVTRICRSWTTNNAWFITGPGRFVVINWRTVWKFSMHACCASSDRHESWRGILSYSRRRIHRILDLHALVSHILAADSIKATGQLFDSCRWVKLVRFCRGKVSNQSLSLLNPIDWSVAGSVADVYWASKQLSRVVLITQIMAPFLYLSYKGTGWWWSITAWLPEAHIALSQRTQLLTGTLHETKLWVAVVDEDVGQTVRLSREVFAIHTIIPFFSNLAPTWTTARLLPLKHDFDIFQGFLRTFRSSYFLPIFLLS